MNKLEVKNENYIDVTSKYVKNKCPRNCKIVYDEFFIDENGIKHPIKGMEKIHKFINAENEIRMAIFLKDILNVDIHLVPRISDISNKGLKTKTPDYIINNSFWDLKTPGVNGIFENTLERFLKKSGAKRQARKIIIDYSNFLEKTNEEILNVVLQTINNPSRNWVEDIIIVRNNNIIKIYQKNEKRSP